ncbi:MAG: hypothetical protein AB7S81_06575 [Bdellovibrionales bacterium]
MAGFSIPKKIIAGTTAFLVFSGFGGVPKLRAETGPSGKALAVQQEGSPFLNAAKELLVTLPKGFIGSSVGFVQDTASLLDETGLVGGPSLPTQWVSAGEVFRDGMAFVDVNIIGLEAPAEDGVIEGLGQVFDAAGVLVTLQKISSFNPATLPASIVWEQAGGLLEHTRDGHPERYFTRSLPKTIKNVALLPVNLPEVASSGVEGIVRSVGTPIKKAGEDLCRSKVGWVFGMALRGIGNTVNGVGFAVGLPGRGIKKAKEKLTLPQHPNEKERQEVAAKPPASKPQPS